METQKALRTRGSYRGKYESTPVPRADLKKIVEAGYLAPSGCNQQTTSFLAVDDPVLLKKLYALVTGKAFVTAPAIVCVLTRQIIAYRDRCYSVQDYSAAIENMLLQVTDLGYESCWVEGHITDTDAIGCQMAEVLGVPKEYELVCFLPVGKAADPIVLPKDPIACGKRRPFGERAWLNAVGKAFD